MFIAAPFRPLKPTIAATYGNSNMTNSTVLNDIDQFVQRLE